MSTRRARIKAVTALPPRRRNVENAETKKKEEENKEGFETGIDVEGSPSSVKKNEGIDHSVLHEQANVSIEPRQSPIKRRLSINKTLIEGFEDGIRKTPKARRMSAPKTSKIRAPIDISPKVRRMSLDKTLSSMTNVIVKKSDVKSATDTDDQTNTSDKTDNSTEPNKKELPSSNILKSLLDVFDNNENPPEPDKPEFSSNILKGLLDAEPRPPNFNSPIKTVQSKPVKPSTSKENNAYPVFASPLACPMRPSPMLRTPVIEVDLTNEKTIAPHKGPNSVKGNDVEKDTDSCDEIIVEKIINRHEFDKLTEFATKSGPETAVMDGIIPLQPVSKVPKPIDLLKNEIISENAEVLFDPIVPLPSPSKVRPKLRPMPRLGPRRNSFQQGSASESEDENRRLHGRPATPATPGPARRRHDSHTSHATTSMIPREVARVRNDSVCSTVSQAPSQAVGSPLRESEKTHKSRREEKTARRNAAMRRRHVEVDRDKRTMYDLIFYNPKSNPIIPDQDEIKAKEANKKEDEERKVVIKQQGSKEEPDAAPTAVPQIKLGPNGEIILDEQSLVVNQSEQRKLETSIVREGAWGGATSRAYRRAKRTADWTDAETVRFYRALACMGTDFTLMQPLFPTRTRRDLKLKFKKEERINISQVDMALRTQAEWDPERLVAEFTEERRAAQEAAARAKERQIIAKQEEKERGRERRRLGIRTSMCSRHLESSALPTNRFGVKGATTLDQYVKLQESRRKMTNQTKRAQKKQAELAQTTITPIRRGSLPPPPRPPSPSFATITLLDRNSRLRQKPPKKPPIPPEDMAVITKETLLPNVPPNIEAGSLVVLTVNDPKSPSRKMLQTYIAQGPGNLTPVSLPANFLNSVVGFMKKTNSPKATTSSPRTPTVSLDSTTTRIISPRKRKNSYTITQL